MNEILLAASLHVGNRLAPMHSLMDHSRAIFSACFATPVCDRRKDSRPALSVVSAIFRPSPSCADQV